MKTYLLASLVALLVGHSALASDLRAFTCKGTYGPSTHSWSVDVTVVYGNPVINGRGFAEILRRPNFPSGIRIAPEGFYVTRHQVPGPQGGTVYQDGLRFILHIPRIQPPMGATAGGFVATLNLGPTTTQPISLGCRESQRLISE